MSSYSASGRVVFEAQGSLAAVAAPSSVSLEQLNAAMIPSMDATLEAALSAIQGWAWASLISSLRALSAIQGWAWASLISSLRALSGIQAWARASLISSLRLLSTLRLLPNLEWAAAPTLAPSSFRMPPFRRRGRPPDSEIVLSVEEIEKAYLTCARELRKRPKRREVATALGVSRSTFYRRCRDENLPFPPPGCN